MENIRNFVIIAHVDHGKSTLADRFLELTNTVAKEKMRPQFLDMMDLERERGVTIKMQPVCMEYYLKPDNYQLNLIDTPGHIDFSYEVSRSLAAVEGAILLVDATKGIQAQTIHNLELAKTQKLKIIPAVNKIDLSQAKTEETRKELSQLLKVPQEEIFLISAKKGTNVEDLLKAVIQKTPFPKGEAQKPFRALIFDSKYDSFKGVISYVRVFDGEISKGEEIYLMATKTESKIKEVGTFKPHLKEKEKLTSGQIGYIATGVKEPGLVRVGDTLTKSKTEKVTMLPGYKEPKPMVFASFYPESADDFNLFKKSLSQLKLNDAALTFEPERKESLGRGFRCGFLGTFHAEITSERLRREFGLNLIISRPQVIYRVIDIKNQEKLIYSASEWPRPEEIKETQEPWAKLEVINHSDFLGQVLELLEQSGGKPVETKYLPSGRLVLIYEIPLREIVVDFYDKLKGISQGFASMNYESLGYRKADLVKLDILIGGEKEEAFSGIVPKEKAFEEGKKIVSKLKEVLPPQLFSLPLQAAIGEKIIARETIKAKRKDVTAPLYGGDYTRKRKLLEKQKKGKRKLKEKGRIKIPPEAFLEMFRG
jgi:GTP-binding protein LepA